MATTKTPTQPKTKLQPKNSGVKEMCPICQETGKLYNLECGHGFHEDCLKKIIKLECPICRAAINNIRRDIKMSICHNAENYQAEQQQEEFEILMNQYHYNNSGANNNFFPPMLTLLAPQMPMDGDDMEMNIAGIQALQSLAQMMRGMSVPQTSNFPIQRRAPQPLRVVTVALDDIVNNSEKVSRLPSSIQKEIRLAARFFSGLSWTPRYARDFSLNIPISQTLEPGEVFCNIVAKFIETYMLGFLQSPEIKAFVESDTEDEDDHVSPPLSPDDTDPEDTDEDEDPIVWYD